MRAHIWKRLPDTILLTQLDVTHRCGHTTRIPRQHIVTLGTLSLSHDMQMERERPRGECITIWAIVAVLVLIALVCCLMLVGWMPGWVR